MDPLLTETLYLVKLAYANSGLLGGLGAALTLSIRVYQSQLVTNLLPQKARWSNLPAVLKVALPFLLAGGGALLTALTGGASVFTAALAALPVALSAIGMHYTTKAAGAMLDAKQMQDDPYGDMSRMRQALLLLLPSKRGAESNETKP